MINLKEHFYPGQELTVNIVPDKSPGRKRRTRKYTIVDIYTNFVLLRDENGNTNTMNTGDLVANGFLYGGGVCGEQ